MLPVVNLFGSQIFFVEARLKSYIEEKKIMSIEWLILSYLELFQLPNTK
jgi:hypothetical protein